MAPSPDGPSIILMTCRSELPARVVLLSRDGRPTRHRHKARWFATRWEAERHIRETCARRGLCNWQLTAAPASGAGLYPLPMGEDRCPSTVP